MDPIASASRYIPMICGAVVGWSCELEAGRDLSTRPTPWRSGRCSRRTNIQLPLPRTHTYTRTHTYATSCSTCALNHGLRFSHLFIFTYIARNDASPKQKLCGRCNVRHRVLSHSLLLCVLCAWLCAFSGAPQFRFRSRGIFFTVTNSSPIYKHTHTSQKSTNLSLGLLCVDSGPRRFLPHKKRNRRRPLSRPLFLLTLAPTARLCPLGSRLLTHSTAAGAAAVDTVVHYTRPPKKKIPSLVSKNLEKLSHSESERKLFAQFALPVRSAAPIRVYLQWPRWHLVRMHPYEQPKMA